MPKISKDKEEKNNIVSSKNRTHCFHGTCYYEDDAFIYGAGSIRAEAVAERWSDR